MNNVALLLGLGLLSGCVGPKAHESSPAASVARMAALNPDYSVVHIKGTISDVHQRADWPESVKVGDAFEGWVTIDNHVADNDPQPSVGQFVQGRWPAHFDMVAGRMVLSAKNGKDVKFGVTVYDKYAGTRDGYFISTMHGITLPEAPRLKNIRFSINVASNTHDIVASDQLPVRTVPIGPPYTEAAFNCYAEATSDGTLRALRGTIEKMEVLQAMTDHTKPSWRSKRH